MFFPSTLRVVPEVLFFLSNVCHYCGMHWTSATTRSFDAIPSLSIILSSSAGCDAPDFALSQRLSGTVCLGRHLLWSPADWGSCQGSPWDLSFIYKGPLELRLGVVLRVIIRTVWPPACFYSGVPLMLNLPYLRSRSAWSWTPGDGTVLASASHCFHSVHHYSHPHSSCLGFRSFEIRPSASLWLFGAVLLGGVLGLHLISPEAPGMPLRTEIDILSFQNRHQDFRLSSVPSCLSRTSRVAKRALRSGPRREADPMEPSRDVDFIDKPLILIIFAFPSPSL
ncbi:hypothetical protein C8R44DRAFT_41085 [Mycena epipterygia]|nr:hypothetical protein C8R44DRAFT_41085 [Mycena epipterygia]